MKNKKILTTIIIIFLSIYSSYAQPPCVETKPTMVAHWNFNDNNTTDLINGWQCNMTGSVTSVPGQFGTPDRAMRFSWGNYFTVNGDYKMALESYTITAIVRPTDPQISFCQTGTILSKDSRNDFEHYSLYMSDHPFDQNCGTVSLNNFVFAGAAAGADPNSANWDNGGTNPYIVPNDWYCVTLMYNGSTEEMNLWVNSTHVIVNKHWPNNYVFTSPPHDLLIGATDNGGVIEEFFNGDIDDIRIWDNVFLCLDDVPPLCEVCEEPEPNKVAHWGFNGSMNDDINGWTPTVHGAPTYDVGSNGLAGNSLKFNGTTDWLEFASDPDMDLESWTITAIVRPDGFYSGQCEANSILWRGTQFGDDFYSLLFFDNAFDGACNTFTPTNEVFVGMKGGFPPFAASDWLGAPPRPNPFINSGDWYCVAAMYDATDEILSIFVNGVNVSREFWPNNYNYPSNSALRIARALGTHDYYFNGAIDDLTLYDDAFECEELLVAKCGCNNAQNPPLVAHWDFENNVVDNVQGWTGTVFGSPTYVAGQGGSTALKFNGTTDYLRVAHQSGMDLTSWTISAVVRPDGFYSGTCEANSILWKGSQFGNSHYSLLYFDNPFDAACNVYSPNNEVFASFAAGNSTFAANKWLGLNPYFISANNWYCVTAMYDATTEIMELYVNGVLMLSETWNNQYGSLPFGDDIYIGRSNNGSYPYFLNGAIDDIKIYGGVFKCTDFIMDQCENRFDPNIVGGQEKAGKTSSVINVDEKEVMVIPNPASDIVKVILPRAANEGVITIQNSLGATVKKVSTDGSDTYDINVSTLTPGIYIMYIQTESMTTKEKLIITK